MTDYVPLQINETTRGKEKEEDRAEDKRGRLENQEDGRRIDGRREKWFSGCTVNASGLKSRTRTVPLSRPKSFFPSSRTITRQIQSNAGSNRIPFYRNFGQHHFGRFAERRERGFGEVSELEAARTPFGKMGGVYFAWEGGAAEGSSSRFYEDNAVISYLVPVIGCTSVARKHTGFRRLPPLWKTRHYDVASANFSVTKLMATLEGNYLVFARHAVEGNSMARQCQSIVALVTTLKRAVSMLADFVVLIGASLAKARYNSFGTETFPGPTEFLRISEHDACHAYYADSFHLKGYVIRMKLTAEWRRKSSCPRI
ncbi:hypothetical protein KM043_007080 [Ampulex compressa]|nr:hypothetical protein KM043_007080 [Ampulex compressa]